MQRPIDYIGHGIMCMFKMSFKIQNKAPKRKENEIDMKVTN